VGLNFSFEFGFRLTVGNWFTFTRLRIASRMRLWAIFGDFPAPADFGFWNSRFFRRILDFVPVMACLISLFRVNVIIFGLTFQILLGCMFFGSNSTILSVEKVSCLFARWTEKDGDIQLSCQFLGVCLLFFVCSVPPGVGDSIVLRRFAVSAGRALAELRHFLVLYCFPRASSAELRQLLVISAFWRCPVPCVWVRACFVGLRQFLVSIIF
jgi:hypothetical protein